MKARLQRQLEIFDKKTEDESCCKIINGRIVCDTDKLHIRILRELIEKEEDKKGKENA